jgi:hypothetical protein
MSRHKIIINSVFEWDVDELTFGVPAPAHFWNNPKPNLSQSVQNGVVQPRSKSTFSMPILNMPRLFTNPSPVNTSLFDSWLDSFPKFNSYPKNEKKYDHLTDIDNVQFKEFLYSNNFISLESDEPTILDMLNSSVDNEDMIVHLKFIQSSEKFYAKNKKFLKISDEQLTYYFDESKPSVIECKSTTTINSNEVFNHQTKQCYMELHYYNELGIFVKLIKNPVMEKIVPAIVVTDLNNRPLEVHCYYKNQYIRPETISELKPDILSENFNDPDYFNKRDIEFLDMVMI